MFITKKLCRVARFFAGSARAMALPLLDAMIPAGTALAQTAAAPEAEARLLLFPARRGHGSLDVPTAAGREFELPQILEPLAPFKDQMTVVSGLRNRSGRRRGRAHRQSRHVAELHESPFWPRTRDPNGGLTADQIVARARSVQDTPFPSLELCVESEASSSGSCHADLRLRLRLDDLVPRPRRNRCRWSTTRASCSTACSARATRPRSARRSSCRPAACSISSARSAASLRGKLGPADRARMDRVPGLGARDRAQVQKIGGSGFLELRPARCAGRRAARRSKSTSS